MAVIVLDRGLVSTILSEVNHGVSVTHLPELLEDGVNESSFDFKLICIIGSTVDLVRGERTDRWRGCVSASRQISLM